MKMCKISIEHKKSPLYMYKVCLTCKYNVTVVLKQ